MDKSENYKKDKQYFNYKNNIDLILKVIFVFSEVTTKSI